MRELTVLQAPEIPKGTRRKFTKFILTHGHARDIPVGEVAKIEKPISRMQLAVVTTSWWAQHEIWQPNPQIPGPILTAPDALTYRLWLDQLAPIYGRRKMRHSVSIKLMPTTTHETLEAAWAAGFRTVKIYPAGVTHSKEGWDSFEKDMYKPICWALEIGFIVCIHGEEPGDQIDTYAREEFFMINRFKKLATTDFPGGRFNVEHISKAETIFMVGEMPGNITGGLTIQHAKISRNDLLEWKSADGKTGLNPGNHFRPPAQTLKDMAEIRYVMFHADESAYRKFHFGPDSAPHRDCDKFCVCGCPGAHVAPTLGPLVVDLYDQYRRLDHPSFYAFTVENGARAFGIEVDMEQTFELEKTDWIIPESYGGIYAFFAGRTNSWKPLELAALNPELLLAAA